MRLVTRLTAAVIALALPLELIVIAAALSGLEERRQAELDNTVLVGQALAAVVDGFAGDLQSTALATSLALGDQAGPLDQGSAGANLETIAQQYPALRAMFLTDTDGRLIATGTGGALGFDLSTRPYIVALRAGADTVWSGGLAGVQTGETTVAYGRTVRDRNGSARGYLVAAFYPQQLFESLPVRLPSDARVTVIDGHGDLLYDTDLSDPRPDVRPSDELRAAFGGQVVRIVGQPVPVGGDARFGVLAPISRLGWVVGYTRPRASVEAALAARSLAQAGGTVVVIIVAAGVIILIARSLSRPLTTLSETAEAIARGDRPTIPALHTDPELEKLASAMRVMSAAVADRETDLIAQREWLRVTLASIGDAVIATDADARITFLNGPAATLSGWSGAEALGRSVDAVLELRNEATGARAESPIQRVLREGIVVGLANHTVLVAKDGVTRPIDDSAAPIRDADGDLIGVVMVFRDVSERRQAEEKLRESQRHLELALQAARMVAWEWDAATNEVTTSSNLAEVYGLDELSNAEQAFDMIHPEDRDRHLATIQDAMMHGGSYRSDFRVIRPDTGQIVWRDEYGVGIVGDDGRVQKLAGVVVDVTQQRQAESALRESEARFRLAVEASPVILFTHDRDLRYTWASRPFPGFAVDALLGRTDAEVFPPEAAEPLLALKRSALERGARVEQEVTLPVGGQAASGTPRSWTLTIEPFRDAAGEVIGLTGAAVDITEQRALERLQQEFISMVSHELRNPLTAIKGYAQLLERRGVYSARAVESIIRQGDQLDRLVSDLLDSSRLQSGRLELRRQQVNLLEAVAASVDRAQAQTERHEIRLTADGGPLLGFWDPERLEQILNNLLTNAIKYSPDGGEIRVEVEREDGDATVSIRDQGVGIEAEQLPRLFDRFYRASATAARAQGLGVGLYVARELVEAHGGRISVSSDGPGHGATFRFSLSLLGGPAGDDVEGPVLVVDDDASLRELIGEALRGEGYRVVAATDGLSALDRLDGETPSLILLDWMMPRMDGQTFATELRRRHHDGSVPVVVMTAGGEAQDRAASVGAAGFIRKPFELTALLREVARHVRARQETG